MSVEETPDASAESRRYPARPIVGVAGLVVRDEKVLVIRRGGEPLLGWWSPPGGALELGETLLEGVVREVREETGLSVQPLELLAMLDRISRDTDGAVEFHYVLLDWLCEVVAGEPHAGSDASEVAWVSAEELDALEPMEDATRRVLHDALTRYGARV